MRALVGGLQMNYVAANLIAVAVCSLVNFVLSNWLVFPDLQTEADSSLRPE